MDSGIVVKLKNISKKYTLRNERPSLIKKLTGIGATEKNFLALKEINLTVKRGQRIGITGPNGSGKSTLLRVIAGITTQSSGNVYTSGRIVSLMKLDAGFSPDLSGRENILLNGMLNGMSRKEVDFKFQSILEFADIGKFVDAPFYTYSDGMKFRLALSIALAGDCDVLIIDEILVSGDIDFQQKTIEFIRRAQIEKNITTIITSHIPSFIWAFADVYYVMEKGALRRIPSRQMETLVKKVDERWRKSMLISK